jgi:sensor histidine kinase regulating citrate/malate metabolism
MNRLATANHSPRDLNVKLRIPCGSAAAQSGKKRLDRDAKVLNLNESCCKLLGIEKKHAKGQAVREIIHKAGLLGFIGRARSRELGGTGLGLSIVKHIVSAHRGSVAVESTLGRGSSFSIIVPAAIPETTISLIEARIRE